MIENTIPRAAGTLFLFVCLIFLAGNPISAAAADLEVSGWIPYWAVSKGTKDAKKNIDNLDIIHPFAFTVKLDGSLKDLAGLKKSSWKTLFKVADAEEVLVIPTVMWSDGVQMQAILSDPERRRDHIEGIVEMVEKGKYDGVDIDYEAKRSETKDSYSAFLKELKESLGKKMLTCATEARTPPDSLYKVVPATLSYANDYAAIGKYCDRVSIMAYDQRRADIKLNASKAGQPYMPVSDADWVRKVLELTVGLIPKEKIMLGIPTYGHQYEVTVSPDWYQNYTRIGALNPPAAEKLAKKEKVKPSTNRAGEMTFSYATKETPKLSSSLSVPSDTTSGNMIAARALAYANETGKTLTFRYVTWSDAKAIEAKVNLAKEFGVRGVALFKIDGEEDKALWNIFK